MGRRWKRLAVFAAAVVVAGAATFVVTRWQAYRFRVAPTEVTPRPFDPAGWASGSATLRHEMARHLIDSGELVGRPRAEIVGRLGPPWGGKEPEMLEWYLGERQDPTWLMWNYREYLRIYFDEQGACREVMIWGDD